MRHVEMEKAKAIRHHALHDCDSAYSNLPTLPHWLAASLVSSQDEVSRVLSGAYPYQWPKIPPEFE